MDEHNAGKDQAPDVEKLFDGLSRLLDGSADKARAEPVEAVPLADGLVPGGECPDPGPSAKADIDAQASAQIPLKEGLTLSSTWVRGDEGGFEHECLTQVTAIVPASIAATMRCTQKDRDPDDAPRRTCRADLDAAHAYQTVVGSVCFETVRGTTLFSLSRKAFAELKDTGATRHHYVDVRMDTSTIASDASKLFSDFDGVLKRDRRATMRVIVNDRVVDLPVVEASGTLDGTHNGRKRSVQVVASVLDDDRFPLVLGYRFTDGGFSIRYSKISFPSGGELEKRLATDKHVDVYGIYFDFASDRLRPESEAVLREISEVLTTRSDWTLAINGHTDGIGGGAQNLDLSRRRAAAVKRALVERYKVDGNRLKTEGYGASRPKDTNETIEGRARNRRVELVKVE